MQAGQIVAGAPPIRLGSALKTQLNDQPLDARILFEDLRKASGIADDPTLGNAFDGLIVGAAAAAEHRGDIRLFVSPDDALWDGCAEFTQLLGGHPGLRCALIEATYGIHNRLGPAYEAYLQETLPLLATSSKRGASA